MTIASSAAAVAAATSTAPASAVAQTTPTQTQSPAQATVLKGKAPVAKSVLTVRLPRPKEYTLPGMAGEKSGAKLLVVEDHHLPLVTITVSVRGGSLFEDAARPGVADMTASLLTEGTEKRNFEQIARETERIGASLNAAAGAERATVSVSGLSDNTDELVDLLGDVLLHPTFPADRLARVKFQTVAQLTRQESSPAFLAGQLTRQVLYGATTPYGRPAPTPAQIQGITADDLRAFWKARYVNAPDTLIGIAGDVKPGDIYNKLKAALSGWQGGRDASAALPAGTFQPKDKTRIFVVDRPGSQQTVVSFANIGIRRTDPDYFPLLVANYILGGSFNSRLNQKLREDKGYTYGAFSSLSAPKYPGTWGASASVRNAVTAPAVGEFLNEFAAIESKPVSDAELENAKRAIVGSFALTLESPTAVLGRLLDVVDYGLPADYWDTYPQKIQAVTAADIQHVAQKYLGTDRIQLIAVGEGSQIQTGLGQYGSVTVLTPDQVLNPSHETK